MTDATSNRDAGGSSPDRTATNEAAQGDAGTRVENDRPMTVSELLRLPYPARIAGDIAFANRRKAAEMSAEMTRLICEAQQLEDLARAAITPEARHE